MDKSKKAKREKLNILQVMMKESQNSLKVLRETFAEMESELLGEIDTLSDNIVHYKKLMEKIDAKSNR